MFVRDYVQLSTKNVDEQVGGLEIEESDVETLKYWLKAPKKVMLASFHSLKGTVGKVVKAEATAPKIPRIRNSKRVNVFKATEERVAKLQALMNMEVGAPVTYASSRKNTGSGHAKVQSLIVQVVLLDDKGKKVNVGLDTVKLA